MALRVDVGMLGFDSHWTMAPLWCCQSEHLLQNCAEADDLSLCYPPLLMTYKLTQDPWEKYRQTGAPSHLPQKKKKKKINLVYS